MGEVLQYIKIVDSKDDIIGDDKFADFGYETVNVMGNLNLIVFGLLLFTFLTVLYFISKKFTVYRR